MRGQRRREAPDGTQDASWRMKTLVRVHHNATSRGRPAESSGVTIDAGSLLVAHAAQHKRQGQINASYTRLLPAVDLVALVPPLRPACCDLGAPTRHESQRQQPSSLGRSSSGRALTSTRFGGRVHTAARSAAAALRRCRGASALHACRMVARCAGKGQADRRLHAGGPAGGQVSTLRPRVPPLAPAVRTTATAAPCTAQAHERRS